MKKMLLGFFVVCSMVLFVVGEANALVPPPIENPGVGTPGFWKNHPEMWPSRVWVARWYAQDEAISIMKHPTKKDMTYSMFEHSCAATLNVYIGNDAPPNNALGRANVWLYLHPLGSGVEADSSAWQNDGEEIKNILDAYNNGLLNVPARK